MERDLRQTAPGEPLYSEPSDPGRDRGPVLRLLRSKPLLVGLAGVVLLAAVGAVVWLEVGSWAGSGPNAFVLVSGSEHPGHISRSYRTFNGLVRERTVVREGQVLALTYSARVGKGSLSIEVKDPTGRDLWRVNVPQDEQTDGIKTLVAGQAGTYQIVVTGLDTGGSFDLSWERQELSAASQPR
jgi:hypothetical protein